MKITNKYNLSRSRVNSAYKQQQKPHPEILRVTELIDSPRIRLYKIKYWEDIEIDCTDVSSNSIWGTAKHSVIEGAVDDDYEAEVKMQWWTNEPYIKWVSGTLDLYDKLSKTIEDNKWAKIWKYKFADTEDWLHQLNVYAWLARKVKAWEVENIVINVSFMDWVENAYKREYKSFGEGCTYPPRQDMRLVFQLWSNEEQDRYYLDRLNAHLSAHITITNGGQPPVCTPKERWRNPDEWAVMKEGRKRALKLFDNEGEATAWLEKNPDATSIEHRQAVDKRCVKYCMVNKYCDYWKENYEKI